MHTVLPPPLFFLLGFCPLCGAVGCSPRIIIHYLGDRARPCTVEESLGSGSGRVSADSCQSCSPTVAVVLLATTTQLEVSWVSTHGAEIPQDHRIYDWVVGRLSAWSGR